MIGPSENDKFDGNFVIGSSAGPKDGVYVSAYSGTSDRGIGCSVVMEVDI